MTPLRRQAHTSAAKAWEGDAGTAYSRHVDAEERALRFEAEVTRLRECLARCGALASEFSGMTHSEECDARNCDEDGDCRCADDVDGCVDCGAKEIVHTTECSCGAWATRDIAAMADAALDVNRGQGHPECPCSDFAIEEPGPHIAACPYVDESYEPPAADPSYSALTVEDDHV